jgi:hypothetical protein
MCFVRISEQTATFALYDINRLFFITKVESVYCAVRTESLYKTHRVRLLRLMWSLCDGDRGRVELWTKCKSMKEIGERRENDRKERYRRSYGG